MEVNLLQFLKADLLIFATEPGMFTEVRPVQFSNAKLPILVTESGIVIDVKPLQPKNAEFPIVSIADHVIIESDSFVHPLKASSPIFKIDASFVTYCRAVQL